MVIIKLIVRVAVLPFTIPALLGTAAIEVARKEPNWEKWKDFNYVVIELLPWSKY